MPIHPSPRARVQLVGARPAGAHSKVVAACRLDRSRSNHGCWAGFDEFRAGFCRIVFACLFCVRLCPLTDLQGLDSCPSCSHARPNLEDLSVQRTHARPIFERRSVHWRTPRQLRAVFAGSQGQPGRVPNRGVGKRLVSSVRCVRVVWPTPFPYSAPSNFRRVWPDASAPHRRRGDCGRSSGVLVGGPSDPCSTHRFSMSEEPRMTHGRHASENCPNLAGTSSRA